MAGGYNFRGLLGNPDAVSSYLMPTRMAMDFENEVAFMNAYEISRGAGCQVSDQVRYTFSALLKPSM